MNKKFLPGAVLFIIAFVLSNLASLAQVKAQTNTFYGAGAGTISRLAHDNSGFGFGALYDDTQAAATTRPAVYWCSSRTTATTTQPPVGWRSNYNTTGGNNTASRCSCAPTQHHRQLQHGQRLSGAPLQHHGTSNTASGTNALYSNTTGNANTASGTNALFSNTTGSTNMASGANALFSNTTGDNNTASGFYALFSNTTGTYNMANGYEALYSNTTGGFNAANGALVLYNNTTGNFNTATGPGALLANTTGSNNVAVGTTAGIALTTGSGNVCIGAGVNGVAGESNTTRIRNVYTTVANGRAVYVNADNKIGTLSSSRRFKHDIQPMDRSSETLFALKPVTFRYKKDADPSQALSFGLIAEEVAKVSPELITRDEEGKPQTVRYEAVNAMLLNEFLKEHKKNEVQGKTIAELKSTIAQQQRAIEQLATQMQKVSAQVQLNGAPAIAVNP